jgi:hypothetical protein
MKGARHAAQGRRCCIAPRTSIPAVMLALLVAGHDPLAAQTIAGPRRAGPPTAVVPLLALRPATSGAAAAAAAAQRTRPAASRGRYMVAGGFIGLSLGALYAGSQLPKHVDGVRDPVILVPLSGALLGAAAGAIVYHLRRPRS